jgi:hypothetical protein
VLTGALSRTGARATADSRAQKSGT